MRSLPALAVGAACLALLAVCGAEVLPPHEEADAGKVPAPDAATDLPDAGSEDPADAALSAADTGSTAGPDAAAPSLDGGASPDAGGPPPCPADMTCVRSFPFGDDRDTSTSPLRRFSAYSCKTSTNEGGPEIVYRVNLPQPGFLSAAVEEQAGVDVDVHILSDLDQGACLDRGNYEASADVAAGIYYVVIDTFVASGVEQAGAFHVDLGFLVPSRGPCELQTGDMPRVNDGGNHLAMPATGPVVLEAHLVTQEESYRPAAETEHLREHWLLSQSRTGVVMHRTQPWAPLEGGSFYGAGIGSPTLFPVVDEGWYVNMYWTSAARPARGTRMILRLPGTRRAVVVAAGHETGPGDLNKIGGTPEETHYYLGPSTSASWTLGIATNQALPFGPRECD